MNEALKASVAKYLSYPDNTPIQEGDWVMLERGTVSGRVVEVIDTPDLAHASRIDGFGVVIDAPPKGYVFLSEQWLHEDSLLFVRRGPSERTRVYVAASFGVAALLMLPALYSFFSAIHGALTTGEVLVISLGRSEIHREWVTWQAGWARFAGPVVLIVSVCCFDGTRGASIRWWVAGAGTVTGLALLCFSYWFTSLGGVLAWLGLMALMSGVTLIGARSRKRKPARR
jgi:hypothetical protein